ncbi:MAG: hypothetical protein ACREV1_00890 [Gammaproteobacteria bacterium]
MLTMTNPVTIEGYTVYHDDSNEILASMLSGSSAAGLAMSNLPGTGARRFYVLPEAPAIAKDEGGKPIFSLIVYRRDEERIDPAHAGEDVGGGILTFTVELAVPEDKFRRIRSQLRTLVFGSDEDDPSRDVELSSVPFIEGRVSVAVAGETGTDTGAEREFVKTAVGTGKVSGVGANRKAVMVKLTQAGASLMSQIDKLKTLPINVQYELMFEHRLLGITMRVWCDISSSYELTQEVFNTKVGEEDSGYFDWSSRDVHANKIQEVTETLTRNKVAGVTVIPQTSQVDNDTLMSLEKFGLDMLNKEMEKAVEASPPPAEIDRTYIEKFFQSFGNHLNFTMDRQMVLVQGFNPSANISNVFREADLEELVAFVDLRTAFFTFLKIPLRVNADFTRLPIDSVTVTVTYQRERFGGGGREERSDSFNFTSGSQLQTFLAYANNLAEVTYDWAATVHYKGQQESYSFRRNRVKEDFLVVDVGALGIIDVDAGLGLVDLGLFPAANLSFRYHSGALGRTLEQSFLLNKDNQTILWTEVIHEEPRGGYEYKVDWLQKEGDIIEGEWLRSTSARLRLDAPLPEHLEVLVLCSGNFKDGGDQISQVAVRLRYVDSENRYTEEGQLVFTQDNQQQPWKIYLRNPNLRDYEYQYSIIYKDGIVRNFPDDGSWYQGEPGFITVGEKYTLEVDIFPTLLTYPEHAKVVQVNLSYDDPASAIHSSDSFVFTKESSTRTAWRVRGAPGATKSYRYQVQYFSGTGEVTTSPPVTQNAEAIVIAPLPAPTATPPSPVT